MPRSRPLPLALFVLAPFVLAPFALACRPVPTALIQVEPEPSPDTPQVFVEAERREPDDAGAQRSYEPLSAEYASLYACWFESPYEYMFEDRGDPLYIDGRPYGMMMAGISGILYYGDFNECAGRISGQTPRSYSDYAPIEALAGVSASVPSSFDFDAVNPEFVTWARKVLLPPGEQEIRGIPVQMAYERVFQRFFRAMGESFLWLNETYSVTNEAQDYLRDTERGADGIDWLESRYAAIPIQDAYADGTMMTGQMAAGFWLRRSLDGSAAACWYGLRDVLEAYDHDWLYSMEQAYPQGAQFIAQLPDPLPPSGN